MSIASQMVSVIERHIHNPVFEAFKTLGIPALLRQSHFTKKEGIAAHMVVLNFLFMLVMNTKLSTYIAQRNDGLKKDVYYRLLNNPAYHWRKLLLLMVHKILAQLHPLKKASDIVVMIIDDTVEKKVGKKIEGSSDHLFSNKEKRKVRGINMISLNLSDGLSNFMLDFALVVNKHARVPREAFTHKVDHRTLAHRRRLELDKSKLQLAIDMVARAVKQGIYADFLLVDSWYSKPVFLKKMNLLGLRVISRMSNNNSIWNFEGKRKSLNELYRYYKDIKKSKRGTHGKKITFTYFSIRITHKKAGRISIVFLKTESKLISLVSTDTTLSDEEVIAIYKRRWDIEQGYKELRQYFGFGKEENRVFEALIGRISLSLFAYNIVSYIHRINHEPRTLGGLFTDLECELHTLAIGMQAFIAILEEIASIDGIVNRNEDIGEIINTLRVVTGRLLGMGCES